MENREHITWGEMKDLMFKFNEEHNIHSKGSCNEYLVAVVVIDQKSFDKPYSVIERSYEFTNDNKAFIHGQSSNSIFADCLDRKDVGVRLDYYIHSDWKVEYCYIKGVEKVGEE